MQDKVFSRFFLWPINEWTKFPHCIGFRHFRILYSMSISHNLYKSISPHRLGHQQIVHITFCKESIDRSQWNLRYVLTKDEKYENGAPETFPATRKILESVKRLQLKAPVSRKFIIISNGFHLFYFIWSQILYPRVSYGMVEWD